MYVIQWSVDPAGKAGQGLRVYSRTSRHMRNRLGLRFNALSQIIRKRQCYAFFGALTTVVAGSTNAEIFLLYNNTKQRITGVYAKFFDTLIEIQEPTQNPDSDGLRMENTFLDNIANRQRRGLYVCDCARKPGRCLSLFVLPNYEIFTEFR